MSSGCSIKREFEEEESKEYSGKKQRINDFPGSLTTASSLVQSLNLEMSTTTSRKRSRSSSSERNVRARLCVDLTSSNPEPATFLMDIIANELDNINKMMASGSRHSLSSHGSTNTPSPRSSPSPESSPDYYDKLIMRGQEVMDRMQEDPFFKKFLQ